MFGLVLHSTTGGQHLRLFDHCPRRFSLFVRRIAVFPEDTTDQPTKVRPHVLTQRPVDCDVVTYGLDQLAGDVAQSLIAEHLDRAVVGFEGVVEGEFIFRKFLDVPTQSKMSTRKVRSDLVNAAFSSATRAMLRGSSVIKARLRSLPFWLRPFTWLP